MSAPKTVADVLDAAADLLTPEGAWTQGAYVRDEWGSRDDWKWPEKPKCFCALGALAKVAAFEEPNGFEFTYDQFSAEVLNAIGYEDYSELARWNDHRGRTQAEVIAKLREAASLARATASLTQGDGHGG